MLYNHTEACDVVWGSHNYTIQIVQDTYHLSSGKFLGACNGWQFVLDGQGDDVACRQVGYIISESKRHISVITRKPQAWKHFFSGLRRLYIRADCKGVCIHRDTK